MRPLFATLMLLILSGNISARQGIEGTGNEPVTYVWTLEESIRYALEHNITIEQAELDLENAELSYSQSKYALLPSVSGNVNQRWSNGSVIDPITSDFINQKSSSTSLSVNSALTLFNGFQTTNQIKQSRLLTEQNELFLEEARNNIQLSVLEAYVQALYAKEAVSIAEKQLEASQQELEQARGLYQGRSLTLKDLNDIESQVANNEYNLIQAKSGYEQQLLALKQLLELDANTELELVAPPVGYNPSTSLPERHEVYQTALSFLPEVDASETNIAISGAALDIAKGARYPTLSLSAGLSSGYTQSLGLSFVDQLDGNFSQSVGIALSIPIFNKFSTSTNIQKAKIGIKQAELNLQSTQKELYRKIESAWLNAASYQQQLRAAETSRVAARSSYELAQAQFNIGELTATDLIVAQVALNTAELNYLQAKYLTILYTRLLEFYQGKQITL